MTLFGHDNTKDLNDKQLETFIYLVNQIINNTVCVKSNDEISRELRIPVSTLEKHLKKLDDLKLIIRKSSRGRNPLTMSWETISREIRLDPKVYDNDPRVLATMRMQRINGILDMIGTPAFTKGVINQRGT